MKTRLLFATLVGAGLAAWPLASGLDVHAAAPAASCSTLASMSLPDTTVKIAEEVAGPSSLLRAAAR